MRLNIDQVSHIKGRETKNKDIDQVRYIKSEDNRMLRKDEEIKERLGHNFEKMWILLRKCLLRNCSQGS